MKWNSRSSVTDQAWDRVFGICSIQRTLQSPLLSSRKALVTYGQTIKIVVIVHKLAEMRLKLE